MLSFQIHWRVNCLSLCLQHNSTKESYDINRITCIGLKHFSGKSQTGSTKVCALMGNQAFKVQKSADHEDGAHFVCFSISCQEGTTSTDVYPRIQPALETELKKMHFTENEILEICHWPPNPVGAENKVVRVKFGTDRGKATDFHRNMVQLCYMTIMLITGKLFPISIFSSIYFMEVLFHHRELIQNVLFSVGLCFRRTLLPGVCL